MFAEALTHDVCIGKDTKAAAAPEESDTDAEESEAAEEAGPSSKDLAKDTPVGESHGCWCVWSSDPVLLRQGFHFWAVWLGMSLASYGKIQYRLRTLRLANASYFMRIISCTYSYLQDCTMLQAFDSLANWLTLEPAYT